MKRKYLVYLLAAVMLLMLTGCGEKVSDPKASSDVPEVPKVDAKVLELQKQVLDSVWEYDAGDYYHTCYAIATPEQREALEKIILPGDKEKIPGTELSHSCFRQIRMVMGLLPPDTPRITVEQAKEILNQTDWYEEVSDYLKKDIPCGFEDAVMGRFDQIAGAADVHGDFGIEVILYYLDDEYKTWLDIGNGWVDYVDKEKNVSERIYEYEGRSLGELETIREEKEYPLDKKIQEERAADRLLFETLEKPSFHTEKIIYRQPMLEKGQLSKDLPNLSVETAKQLMEEVNIDEIYQCYKWSHSAYPGLILRARFDAVCGAPDYVLSDAYFYYLDEKQKASIVVLPGAVYVTDDNEIICDVLWRGIDTVPR